ncbi:MAG: UDP-N-acetylglucosamine 2-epimerase (non-hydrolyzing), partial [Chloroflexota bacterium]
VVADLHFAPTAWARDNLLREGVPDGRIAVTGNPGLDALRWALALPFDPSHDPLADLPPDKRILLVTAHRRENQAHIGAICAALRRLAARGDVHVVYPVHLNPNIHEPVLAALGDAPHVSLLAPLDYQPLVRLMQHSALVLTDSGGIQEEAPALGKPVLVLRDVTERPEGVAAGTARLVGPHEEAIVAAATRLLDDPAAYEAMAHAVNPYGDGHAAERIVARLLAEGAHG